MSSYKQYKSHIFDKAKNRPYCQAKPAIPEYAKTIDDIDCELCLKLVDATKREIARDNIKKALDDFNTKDQNFIN